MSDHIAELAAAKVNLTLEVLGRRVDGMHELQSLVVFARDIGDLVTLDVGAPPGLTVTGPFAGAIVGENLIARALQRLAEVGAGLRLGRVVLDKRLPVAAGIGGGSADAGALLRAVKRANPATAARVDWTTLAAALGADVPVCLAGSASLVSGAGEAVRPVAITSPLAVVLVNPMVPVPADKTRQVFQALGLARDGRLAAPGVVPGRLDGTREIVALMARTGNGLTEAASRVVPAIGAVLAALEATEGCRIARLSGAGPTCLGVFDQREAAASAARLLSARHAKWWVRSTLLG